MNSKYRLNGPGPTVTINVESKFATVNQHLKFKFSGSVSEEIKVVNEGLQEFVFEILK